MIYCIERKMMEQYKIIGGRPLYGRVKISGAKNAALPLMAASLLTEEKVVLHNIPNLADVLTMKQLLEDLGKSVSFIDHTMVIEQKEVSSLKAPYETVRTMRASIAVLGPLLAKYHSAVVSLPGGCSIGNRPVDLHLKAMELLGAEIELDEGYIYAKTKEATLIGADLYLVSASGVTVLGTANALMAATLARGKTVIDPAATEPEIGDLIDMLQSMGARIEGKGTGTLTIYGVEFLRGVEHSIIPDRIETGTFLAMVSCTGGELVLENTNPEFLRLPIFIAKEMGVEVISHKHSITVRSHGKLKATDIITKPYPDFPTDLQPQYMVMLTLAEGESKLNENIFEDRLHHVAELVRMGAKISEQKNNFVLIHGVSQLKGAPVMASDLRAGAALVIAGLASQGTTFVDRIYHIDRGYEDFEAKIGALGGQIERIRI
ncbi:UDP-N-acetylglucosamine 1-carboxyvinyltransferase-like [Periplaneta americana]|uniref:UDP-N-acetylglucosamine 1-carboxyvinyltransferase-like n=1 Tax=Periplaneta americana TaxID=6978 RepID=UPI0037E7393A